MLNYKSEQRLRERLKSAFNKSPNDLTRISSVVSQITYTMLDASDIYDRVADAPFPAVLINSCVELTLRRDGFNEVANIFLTESFNDKEDYE